jgi:hypothetical protein
MACSGAHQQTGSKVFRIQRRRSQVRGLSSSPRETHEGKTMLYKKKYAGMKPCSLPHLCASPHKLMLYEKKYAGMEPCSLPHLCASPHKLIRPSPSASLSLLSLSLLFLFLFSIFSLSLALSLSLLLFLSPSVFVCVWIGGARGKKVERR